MGSLLLEDVHRLGNSALVKEIVGNDQWIRIGLSMGGTVTFGNKEIAITGAATDGLPEWL
jgi:hypothetical protein